MTRLHRMALMRLPLSKETVEYFYENTSLSGKSSECIKTLCESHERLRSELEGAELLLEELMARQKKASEVKPR
jgi:hypothetical protein